MQRIYGLVSRYDLIPDDDGIGHRAKTIESINDCLDEISSSLYRIILVRLSNHMSMRIKKKDLLARGSI